MRKNELKKWRENYTPFTGVCLGEGLKLNVHFDEKDFVKENGGRWNPDPSGGDGYWWMPAGKLNNDCPLEDEEHWGAGGSGTIQDWLNNHKMLTDEIHGTLNDSACDAATAEVTDFDIYALRMGTDPNTVMQFVFFKDQDIVKVIGDGGTAWSFTADARALWNKLVETVDARREKGGSERYINVT